MLYRYATIQTKVIPASNTRPFRIKCIYGGKSKIYSRSNDNDLITKDCHSLNLSYVESEHYQAVKKYLIDNDLNWKLHVISNLDEQGYLFLFSNKEVKLWR